MSLVNQISNSFHEGWDDWTRRQNLSLFRHRRSDIPWSVIVGREPFTISFHASRKGIGQTSHESKKSGMLSIVLLHVELTRDTAIIEVVSEAQWRMTRTRTSVEIVIMLHFRLGA